MPANTKPKQFRFNPVELAIFTGISLVLAHQVYSLFYDGHGAGTASRLTQLPAVAWERGEPGANSASAIAPLFLSYELKCGSNTVQTTGAGKFRLTGSTCGDAPPTEGRKPASGAAAVTLIGTKVTNLANQFSATVFTDSVAGKFSTDYIPLNTGKNSIHVEFRYSDGRTVAQDFTVEKTAD